MAILAPSILAADPVNLQRDLTMTEQMCAKRLAGAGRGGAGYSWQEGQGDNRYFVEKICDYFFYYEADF